MTTKDVSVPMTAVAMRPIIPPPATGESALMLWAKDAHQANQIAKMLASTSFVPASLRGKAEDLTAALLAGQELGLQPMATLRSIDIIQGTPALRAHAMRGLVQARGYDVEVVESDDQHCVMRGRRGASAGWQSVTWDLDRAKRLGLTSKDQWLKQPRTMLIARATGEICRLIAADVLYAMPYAAEELDEQTPVRATATVTGADLLADAPNTVNVDGRHAGAVLASNRPSFGAETVRPAPPAVADLETEPVIDTSNQPPIEIGDAPPAITPAQSRKLHTLLGKTGRGDRDEGLKYLTVFLRRPVTTTKTLTFDEASMALDDLEADLAAREAAAADVNAEQPELS